MDSIEHSIRSKALQLGFSQCGFAEVVSLDKIRDFYDRYLEENRPIPFSYVEKHRDKRLDPRLLVEGARSVIAVSLNYYPAEPPPEKGNFVVAKYALDGDHYLLIRERLNLLAQRIRAMAPDALTRIFVDSGPVLEKYWAQRCGIGWIGKNSLLVNRETGSFCQIGILFTDLVLEPDVPETDRCGACNRCRESCPTGALATSGVLDIRRCIAYHTIENKEEIPAEIRSNLHGRIFGCDICQDVCPYNKPDNLKPAGFYPVNRKLREMTKEDWLKLTEEQFRELFEGTPVKRRGYRLFIENILAAGNIQL